MVIMEILMSLSFTCTICDEYARNEMANIIKTEKEHQWISTKSSMWTSTIHDNTI